MSTAHVSPADYQRKARRKSPERDTQSVILDWLAVIGIKADRIETNGQPLRGHDGKIVALRECAHVGHPDISAHLPWGQSLVIEVKRAGQGKTGLRRSQALWITETARLSPWTMILIAESHLEVDALLRPLMREWKAFPFLQQMCSKVAASEPWQDARTDAISAAARRLERAA